MAYSGDISNLESCINNIESVSLENNFSSVWEGNAYNKQNELINNLKTELDNEVTQVKTLINALKNIDSYNTEKDTYNTYNNLLSKLSKDDSNYESYLNSVNTASQHMSTYKEAALKSLGNISSSYNSKIDEIIGSDPVSTSVSLITDALFDDTADVTATTTESNTNDWTAVSTSSSSGNYSSSSGNYSSSSGSSSSGGSSSGGSSSSGSSSSGSTDPYESPSASSNYVVDKIDMSDVPDAPEDTICAANVNLNVKSDNKGITSTFSLQTQEIVSKHANDFNYSNFKSIIGGDEDFENYCKNVLGGVFAKWTGKNKKGEGETASEFQEIAEYVFGLMVLYGFDYCNGSPGHYGKYGANNSDVASNAFYPSGVYNSPGKNDNTNGYNIDTICAGTQKDGVNMTTNCNYGMDYLYHKAGVLGGEGQPSSSCNIKSLLSYASKNGGGITTQVDNLQVGDLIQCYKGSISEADAMSGDVSKWKKNGGWYHVCCVGEIEKNEAGETVAVVLYDAGHRFTNSGNFKYRVELDPSNTRKLGAYSDHWVGINLGTVAQDSFTKVVST